MIKICCVITGWLRENSYIVYDDKTLEGLLIDPGANPEKIETKIKDLKVNIKAILLTHGHFDHTGAVNYFKQKGIPVYVHANEVKRLKNPQFDTGYGNEIIEPDYLFSNEEERIKLAGIDIKVLLTKGHTDGSVCYIIGKNILSGDTLFYSTYGRTDLTSGSQKDMVYSLQKILFELDGDYAVFPGHGETTTLNYERKYNPINIENINDY